MEAKKSLNQWSRKELLSLPVRAWDKCSSYDTVLVISTRKKHDSGFAMMAIIGVNDGVPVEIAGNGCDDIEWVLPDAKQLGTCKIGQFRTDCMLKSGAIQAWSRGYRFDVSHSLSSMTIELIKAP